jgi:hypothetical protein
MGWWSHQQAVTWCGFYFLFDIFGVYLTSIRTFFSPFNPWFPPFTHLQKSMANSIPFPRSKHSGRRHGSLRKRRSSRMKMPMSISNVPGEGTGLGTLAFQWPEGNVVEKMQVSVGWVCGLFVYINIYMCVYVLICIIHICIYSIVRWGSKCGALPVIILRITGSTLHINQSWCANWNIPD